MRAVRLLLPVLTILTSLALMPACSSGDAPPPYIPVTGTNSSGDAGNGVNSGTSCTKEGEAGCPCDTAGEVASCGRIESISGDYVTCMMGNSVCDGTQWGQCEGNRIVAQSLRGHTLTTSGVRLLSMSGSCSTPCDPSCSKTVGNPTLDVDAGGLTYTDAGVTITATTGTTQSSGPCKGLWCQVQTCQGQPKTSLSGVVYDPAGKNPLYDAYVYIPVDPTVALPAFTTGASCDTCSGASSVSAIAVAQTGPDGKFTLTNVPAGTGVGLVVQMGKWRRKITLPSITACTNNTVAPSNSRLPRNHTDGDNNQADIPHMAIATGSADPFECLLLKAGLDPNEIKAPGNGTRVNYYVENGIDRSPGGAPNGSTLTGSLTTLKTYDVVLLPCEGSENDTHVTDVPNLTGFADIGGRIFTTHYGYSWLATPKNGVAQNKSEFYGTADWSKLSQNDYNDPMTAMIDQTFPKGLAYAQWLQNLGATTTQGSLTINEPRHDARSATNPPSQRWVYGSSQNAGAGVSDMLLGMTFNTPTTVTQDKQCGRVVYSDFHVSADALASTTKASCTNDNACGFTSTCNGENLGSCSTKSCEKSTDCAMTGFSCVGAVNGNCATPACYSAADCPTGRTCSGKLGNCSQSCFVTADCAGISGTGCSGVTKGTCSALSCKADTDCGVGTCNGEAKGSCALTTSQTCYGNSDCTSLNSSATCPGGATGTCSTNCKTGTDCGTGTCSGSPKQGTCVPPATTCYKLSECTVLNASATCSGGKTGTCQCLTKAECGAGTCNGAAQGVCKKKSTSTTTHGNCYYDSDCPPQNNGSTAYSCFNQTYGSCSISGCETSADCGGLTCSGATAGSCVGPTGHSCWLDSDCASLGAGYTCSGEVFGTCPAKTGCTTNASCGGTRTCVGSSAGTCTLATSCWTAGDCGSSATCNGAVVGSCSSVACAINSDCGASSGRTCQNAKPGTCTGTKSCKTLTDCSGGTNATCSGAAQGTCNAQTCYVASECGTGGTCVGGQTGACQDACTSDAQCATGLTCVSGLCTGCYKGSSCPSGTCTGGAVGTCSAASTMFPLTCLNGDLSAQEKALEFMLFDLSACVSPDSWTPPTPGVSFGPVTFNLDFMASCPHGQNPIWREFDWQAQIPSTGSISFAVQTASTASSLTQAPSAPLTTATTSTNLPNFDAAMIDTGTAGAFRQVTPQLSSLTYLRVATTLNPTTDNKSSPTLINWEVHYDCVDAQ